MKERTAFQCEHCGRLYKTPRGCAKHEARCFRNPDRTPLEGELFTSFALGMRLRWMPDDEALPEGSVSYIWDGRQWLPLPPTRDYSWPVVRVPGTGTAPAERAYDTPVNECERTRRLEALRYTFGPPNTWCTEEVR